MKWLRFLPSILAVAFVACAEGQKGFLAPDSGGGGTDLPDAAPDAQAPSSTGDGAADVSAPDADAKVLDPELDVPPGSDVTCYEPGTQNTCAAGAICRIATTTGGRCEQCGPCGPVGAACTESAQCELLLQCYKGHCAQVCRLGTTVCGAGSDCLDVGHATHGVCR